MPRSVKSDSCTESKKFAEEQIREHGPFTDPKPAQPIVNREFYFYKHYEHYHLKGDQFCRITHGICGIQS